MQLKRFEDVEQFYQRVEAFLLSHEAEHNLILGICSTLLRHPDTYPIAPYLATIEQNGEVVLVIVRTPPHYPVLSLPAETMDVPQALGMVAADLRAVYGDVPGVHGLVPLGRAFAEIWQRLTGHVYRVAQSEGIYQLDKVDPVADVPGGMRRATEADRPLLERWVDEFFMEALGSSMPHAAPDAWVTNLFADPARAMYLWIHNEPVAMAGYGNPTPGGIRIEMVYTPPAYRRRGYASACVAAVSQMLLDSGRRFCFLFTDLANLTSNHIYQEIGYRPIRDVEVYEFAQD